MTTLPRLLRALYLLLLLAGAVNLSGCDADTPPPTAATPDAAAQDRTRLLTELFSLRPPNVQPRNQPLTIGFRQPVISDDKVGSSAEAYLKLSPDAAGKAQFDTTSSIVFVPDAPLASGQAYTLTVKPDGLLNIPAATQPIEFAFKTAALELDVQPKV
ncbi:MAG: hypothetical protein BWK73_52030 [Thiothrix lacustris]|uniref:SbsA Ig-like domain-containing protein n=1 Tax=Thiothrix lacustris TaxID=525917 RepID=A0A1Y1Q7X1_9GAMM|nr:MAG: hypothetical protein BWK73_52030 [Thiothrix lacustris]